MWNFAIAAAPRILPTSIKRRKKRYSLIDLYFITFFLVVVLCLLVRSLFSPFNRSIWLLAFASPVAPVVNISVLLFSLFSLLFPVHSFCASLLTAH